MDNLETLKFKLKEIEEKLNQSPFTTFTYHPEIEKLAREMFALKEQIRILEEQNNA